MAFNQLQNKRGGCWTSSKTLTGDQSDYNSENKAIKIKDPYLVFLPQSFKIILTFRGVFSACCCPLWSVMVIAWSARSSRPKQSVWIEAGTQLVPSAAPHRHAGVFGGPCSTMLDRAQTAAGTGRWARPSANGSGGCRTLEHKNPKRFGLKC